MYGVKMPIVYTNVLLRNWTAFTNLGISRATSPGMYHTGVNLGRSVQFGDYQPSTSPDDPMILHMTRTPCAPGHPKKEQHRLGRADLLATTFETFERNIRDQLGRTLEGGGFDAARDIEAITVNRWPHGYAYSYNTLDDPIEWALFAPDDRPCVIASKQLGRISIANSDAGANPFTDVAIDEAHRAVGEVLAAVAQAGLSENTLVIFTTDHGLPWPGAKCNLGDSGTGVALIMRGPDGFSGGQMVDALVSQVDIFPTLTGLAGLPPSPWVRGKSLVPLVQGETDEVRDEIFAEVTCHAAYEPMRAIRTRDWLYIRRFSNRHSPVLANVDDGDAKRIFLNNGWENVHLADRQLYNVILDPFETRNLADDPERKAIVLEMDDRLNAWMSATDDPLLDPTWQPPAHFRLEPSG